MTDSTIVGYEDRDGHNIAMLRDNFSTIHKL